jgi:hypothetical protein
MDLIKLEEDLSHRTIVYESNPGEEGIEQLREFYDVEVISRDQIKITYKV